MSVSIRVAWICRRQMTNSDSLRTPLPGKKVAGWGFYSREALGSCKNMEQLGSYTMRMNENEFI